MSSNTSSNRKNYIMFFDTETTGLFPKNNKDLLLYPYITQLCFVIYDVSTHRIVKCYNEYINIPSDIVIEPFITKLTGITREKCNNGVRIVDALHEFYKSYMAIDSIVAHNLSFDVKMVETEIQRNFRDILSVNTDICFIFDDAIRNVNRFCTMILGKPVCNIVLPKRTPSGLLMSETFVKVPKLSELYEKLFEKQFENSHNALYDTLACMRCFVKIYYDITLDEKIMTKIT